jgi:hypothetical protein
MKGILMFVLLFVLVQLAGLCGWWLGGAAFDWWGPCR